jgi:signal transduction histidine kinase
VGVGRALSLRGYLLLQLGDLAHAAPLLHRAERLLASAPLALRADNHSYLAWLLGDTDQPGPALRYLRRAYVEYGRLGNAAGQAELSGTATVVYLYQGRGDSAAYVLLRAARMQHRLGLKADEATTLGNLATVLHQLDRLPEADRYARQALATMQQLHDESTQSSVYQTLGNIAWARHRPTEAVPYYRACIQLLKRQHNEGPLAPCYGSLAGALSDLGQGDSAIYYQTKAVRLCQQLGQTTQAATEMSSLARIYAQQRRWPEAERWARASLAAQGDKLLQNTRALMVLEQVAEQRGDFREALRRERQVRAADNARAARESQRLVQEQRARFETDRAEQQVALLTARTQLQAGTQELERLRFRQQMAGLGGLGLLALAIVGGMLWQYRRRQAAREEALRTRLAADLHDDVGTLLSQICMQSGVLQEGLADPASQRLQLGQISEASRSAVRQLNDVVWSLDAHNDHLPNLLDRMRDYAYDVLPAAGIEVKVESSEGLSAQRLSVLLRRNLYLIFKESLHNILKHANGATCVRVSLHQEGSRLVLEIQDNGRPASVAAAANGQPGHVRRSGHGLRNMQQRAAAVGGEASSGPMADKQGFQVRITVPLLPA